MELNKQYATEQGGMIKIISGTRCGEQYCRESGCDFPGCASFSGEEFASVGQARAKYSDLEIV